MADAAASRVILLAAGRGARMGVLGEQEPKSLLPVAGEPFAARLIRQAFARGVIDVTIEAIGIDDYGSSGTMFATAYLTDILRTAVTDSGARAVGFHGVMDSLLEDPAIGERTSRGTLGLDALLSFAAVCGCGLDMVPIPGDTYVEEIASLILDVAAMSCALGKPLGARILPIPGKAANEFTDFGHDFFFNCRILAVRNRAVKDTLFERGAFELRGRS